MRRDLLLSVLATVAAHSGDSTIAKLEYEQKDFDCSPKSDIKIQPIPLNGFSPSPKCWSSAVTLFHSRDFAADIQDASAFCAAMPESYQKRLALEISNCHLQDLGKPLYREVISQIDCNEADSIFDDVEAMLSVCLKRLTPAGEHAYTIYITYVQNMCIRLTQEIVLRYQQENQQELLAQYTDASAQSIKNMIAIRDIANMYADQLIELASVPTKIKDQLSIELSVQLKEVIQTSLQEEMKSQLSAHAKDIMNETIQSLIQNQTDIHEQNLITLMERVERRDEAVKERLEGWIEYLVSLWQRQAVTMDQQYAKLNEQRRQMEAFAATVNSTTNTIQPLLGLQQLMHLAVTGYKWILAILLFTIEFNVIWLATRPGIFLSVRPYLNGILLAKICLEVLIATGVLYGKIRDIDRVYYVTGIRHWSLILQAFVFVSGVIISFLKRILCWQRNSTSDTSRTLSVEHFDPNYNVGSCNENENAFYHTYRANFTEQQIDQSTPTFGRPNSHATRHEQRRVPIIRLGPRNYRTFSDIDRDTIPVQYTIEQERHITSDSFAPERNAVVMNTSYHNTTYTQSDNKVTNSQLYNGPEMTQTLKNENLSTKQSANGPEMTQTKMNENPSTNQSRSTDVIIDNDIFVDPMVITENGTFTIDMAELMEIESDNMLTSKKRSSDGFEQPEDAKRVRYENEKNVSISEVSQTQR